MNDRIQLSKPRRVRIGRLRRGYVLLVLLAVMIVVVTAVADLTRRTLDDQLAAAQATRELQLRWGAHSINETIRDPLPKSFETRHQQWLVEQQSGRLPPERWIRPSPHLDQTVVLGSATFLVRVADESAKVPLNVLYADGGPDAVETVLVKSFGPAARQWPRVPIVIEGSRQGSIARRARGEEPEKTKIARSAAPAESDDDNDSPEQDDERVDAVPQAFAHWSQLLPTPRIRGIAGRNDPNVLPTTVVGPGSPRWVASRMHSLANLRGVNVSRASTTVIEQTAEDVIGPAAAKRLSDRFAKRPTFAPKAILESEIKNESDLEILRKRFSDASTCFSLRVLGQSGGTGQRIERRWAWTLDAEGRLSGSVWAF